MSTTTVPALLAALTLAEQIPAHDAKPVKVFVLAGDENMLRQGR